MASGSPQRSSIFETILYLVASVPLVVALWCAPVLPTHDGPKHLYSAHVRFHIADPAFASAFEPAYPPTSIGFTLLYGSLEKLLPWRFAYGLAWTAVVVALPIGLWQLARAFDRRRAPLCLLGLAGAIHWSVHMGFANYVPSIGLGLLAIGIGVAERTWSVRRELTIYGLLLVTCLFHPVGAQIAALGLFVFRALGTTRGRAVRELGAMVIGCAPAAAITLVTRDMLAELLEKGIFRVTAQELSFGERVANFTTVFVCGPWWRSVPLLAVGAAGIAAALVRLSREVATLRARSVDPRTLAVAVVACSALALALSTPLHTASWEFMQPRFIPPAVFAAIALAPIELLGQRARALVTATFFACAVASNLWVAREHLRFGAEHADAFAGLGASARPGRTLLPIIAREETGRTYQQDRSRPIPYASFLFNIGQLHAVDRQAVAPYSFAFFPNIHPIQAVAGSVGRTPRRDYGELFAQGADPAVRERELVRLASFGVDFDDVLFYGAEDEVERLIALGYRPETRRRGFMIAELVGCPIEVTVDAGAAVGSVLLGWVPSDRLVYTLELTAEGPRSFVVAKGSCGPMWLRWAPANPGEATTCRGADATGALLIPAGTPAVRCEVVGASPP